MVEHAAERATCFVDDDSEAAIVLKGFANNLISSMDFFFERAADIEKFKMDIIREATK